jgi:hypothetical protein
MILLLSSASDEGWLGYIAQGQHVCVHCRTREEARVSLLRKIEELGLPPPPPGAFKRPTAADQSASAPR